jgi:hypothetical protein
MFMPAYNAGGPIATFPTVYDPALGLPLGPLHIQPKADAWLGANASRETDADLLPDADGVLNINPAANTSNADWFDDGVFPFNAGGAITLLHCQTTQFNYQVHGAAAVMPHEATVNVWFDYNSDGDFADTVNCTKPNGVVVQVPEWSVQDQLITVNPGTAIWVTTPFISTDPAGAQVRWMRITLGKGPAPKPAVGNADGRGPLGGYAFGETEDYKLFDAGNHQFYPQNPQD